MSCRGGSLKFVTMGCLAAGRARAWPLCKKPCVRLHPRQSPIGQPKKSKRHQRFHAGHLRRFTVPSAGRRCALPTPCPLSPAAHLNFLSSHAVGLSFRRRWLSNLRRLFNAPQAIKWVTHARLMNDTFRLRQPPPTLHWAPTHSNSLRLNQRLSLIPKLL